MLQAFPQIVNADFTANMETLLDGVADGKVEWKTIIRNFYPDLKEEVDRANEELEKVKVEDEVTDVVCDMCGRNMVIKYGPHGRFLACPGFPECRNTKPYYEKAGVECDFMSWSLPVEKPCPRCGHYMVKKGNKTVCSDSSCGYSEISE